MKHRNPSSTAIRELLLEARTLAVVGLSADRARPSFGVTRSMRDFGYRILPVNPSLDGWEGLPSYATLEEAAGALDPGTRIDIVNVFRRPARVGSVVEDCVRLGVPALWLQLGVVNEDAAARAVAVGMTVVMDRCIYVDRVSLTE
jgi:predicted CoA-binding protein